MTNRELLGPAAVSDAQLAAMVADLLHEDTVELLDLEVTPVDYDLQAITTAGRWWVAGHAATPGARVPFRIFVKHVQNWERSPLFAAIPEHLRAFAAGAVPWRTEPAVYRSDLPDRLPDGLSMPQALGVFDLDEKSATVWLAEVPAYDWPWDEARHRRAAYLLGRLAASPRVAPLAQIDDHQWTVRHYVAGRFTHQVVPMLHDDRLWSHPLLADAFGPELRARMLDAAHAVPTLIEELATGPHGAAHGDACPNNLLDAPSPDDFVLIDFGFWNSLPLGFDLGQLLLGDVQLGRQPAATLASTDAVIVSAYVEGLAAEGRPVDEAVVRRQHALQMLVFSGLSAMPFEHLGAPPSPALTALARDRAAIATYCLDLVDATQPPADSSADRPVISGVTASDESGAQLRTSPG